MELQLNATGFSNLIKPNFLLERLDGSEPGKYRIHLMIDELTNFLSINEVFLNEQRQVTDGSHIYGIVTYAV